MGSLTRTLLQFPLTRRLARGAFWSLAGAVVSRGMMLLAFVVVARVLGQDEFGQLGVIRSTLGMFGVFAGFGLGVTATKYVAELRANDADRAGRIIALTTVTANVAAGLVTVAVYLAAPWLARYALNAPELTGLLRLGCLVLFLNAVNGVQSGTLAGFESFRAIAVVNLLVGLVSFPLLATGVWLAGLQGAVIALASTLAIHWSLNHLALRREMARAGIAFGWTGIGAERTVLWRFTLPALMSNTMIAPVMWLCVAILVRRPDGYSEMAVYYAASQWYVALLFVPRTVGAIVLPVLSDRLGARDQRQASQVIRLSILANAMIAAPMVLAGSLLSPAIMAAYGPEYAGHWPTMVVLLVAAGLVSLQEPVGQLIAARGRMWLGCVMNLGWATVLLTATYGLAHWGALGLAIAHLVAYLIHAAWTFAYAAMDLRSTSPLEPMPRRPSSIAARRSLATGHP